jgi:hypothetical protein
MFKLEFEDISYYTDSKKVTGICYFHEEDNSYIPESILKNLSAPIFKYPMKKPIEFYLNDSSFNFFIITDIHYLYKCINIIKNIDYIWARLPVSETQNAIAWIHKNSTLSDKIIYPQDDHNECFFSNDVPFNFIPKHIDEKKLNHIISLFN